MHRGRADHGEVDAGCAADAVDEFVAVRSGRRVEAHGFQSIRSGSFISSLVSLIDGILALAGPARQTPESGQPGRRFGKQGVRQQRESMRCRATRRSGYCMASSSGCPSRYSLNRLPALVVRSRAVNPARAECHAAVDGQRAVLTGARSVDRGVELRAVVEIAEDRIVPALRAARFSRRGLAAMNWSTALALLGSYLRASTGGTHRHDRSVDGGGHLGGGESGEGVVLPDVVHVPVGIRDEVLGIVEVLLGQHSVERSGVVQFGVAAELPIRLGGGFTHEGGRFLAERSSAVRVRRGCIRWRRESG